MSNKQAVNKFLQKLWQTVFDEHSAGLVSPLQLEREGRSRLKYRADELVLIRQMERDIQKIREGTRNISVDGRVVDKASYNGIEDIKLSSIIETEERETKAPSSELTFASMYKTVQRSATLLDMHRALTIRRIYIFTEAKASSVDDDDVLDMPVDRQWVLRWLDAAQDVRSETLQLMWAKVLGAEVKKPGTFPIRAIDCLSQMNEREAEMLRIASRLSLGDFIYKSAKGYFKPEIHKEMFEKLEEIGIIYGVRYGQCGKTLKSRLKSSFKIVLRCYNKAMFIQGNNPALKLKVPVYGITSLGQVMMRLGSGDADMGYIWAISNDLKEKGLSVTLGDWVGKDDESGLFTTRVET